MSTIKTNFLFAEEHIIEALRDIEDLVSVGSYTSVPQSIEAAGPTPAAFVVFEGSGKATGLNGAASRTSLYWTTALLIRDGRTQGSQETQRALAGELLVQMYNKVQGLTLPNCRPLQLVDGPNVKYYPGGQGLYYLTFEQVSPLLPG